MACKNCGSSEVDNDNAHGYSICMGCGNVLEDQVRIVLLLFKGFSAHNESSCLK